MCNRMKVKHSKLLTYNTSYLINIQYNYTNEFSRPATNANPPQAYFGELNRNIIINCFVYYTKTRTVFRISVSSSGDVA